MSAHGSLARAMAPAGSFASRLLGTLDRRIELGELRIDLPDGTEVRLGGRAPGPHAAVQLADWRTLRRVVAGGAVGFAEGYMAGEWTSPDLPTLLESLSRNNGRTDFSGSLAARLVSRLVHAANANSRRGSRRNISYHYDLGNSFYERWLDEGMQYSSALYAEGDDLEAAQRRKLERIAAMLGLRGGERVLEIGCGWGALAEHLARHHDAHVTGLTLSSEQLAYAGRRLAQAGLAGKADLRLQDYRDCGGTFDRIVSIEMIEAVGERYWPRYFGTLHDRLAAGGSAVLQAITISPGRFDAYRRRPDFIQRNIFPGGMLPTLPRIAEEAGAAGLEVAETESFGASYARTLAEWRRRFHHAWPDIAPLGFDMRFRRMWDYYLAYCEAGFRAGTIDVSLVRLTRTRSAA